MRPVILCLLWSLFLVSCGQQSSYDYVITGGSVYIGDLSDAQSLDIALKGGKIAAIGESRSLTGNAIQAVDAKGMIVTPGFIDPHTHSFDDLSSLGTSLNINYLTQGVTTVLTGNDGGGPIDIAKALKTFQKAGIGTNAGLFAGHKTIRTEVMSLENRPPSNAELEEMTLLLKSALSGGAFGFSTGLYYVPGSFATTDEVIALASVLNETGGVYESHIRDESSYSVGLIAAIEEVITIGREANVPVHIAHIKALGVDVWGKSDDVIAMIEEARRDGVRVTADQYPWRASGTRVSNALIPNWVKADSTERMIERLQDESLKGRIDGEIAENLRKRGGDEALLIINGDYAGRTLDQVATKMRTTPVETARRIVIGGDARVASFNMTPADIENFMRQSWVMTSSDGTKGHPRKYASFPRKYQTYVKEKDTLSLAQFIHKSTGLVADTFDICGRGYLQEENWADIMIFDPDEFSPNADFSNPEELSTGVEYLFVNGVMAIDQGSVTGLRPGQSLMRGTCSAKTL